MSPIERKKFEEEFIEDLIIYIYYKDILPKEIFEITLKEFKDN
jgi:methionyl-tRNA formyltransferase